MEHISYHRPVMFDEVLDGLNIKDNGVYFDGTLGGGGHSFGILSRNQTARLIATDKDNDAIQTATERLKKFEGRFQIYKSDYKNYGEILNRAGVDKLDGVLLDFGISSHQIDDQSRGFSYLRANAPLDMRMDQDSAFTAETVVNEYDEQKLYRIIRDYGEEKFASVIVRNIIKERAKERIVTCGQLRQIVMDSMPARLRTLACARQTFQAIRIEVNGELTGLRECVRGFIKHLKPQGRICILTFHSLEDRVVKQTFQELNEGCICPKTFPVCVCGHRQEILLVNKKPIVASAEEVKENSRSKCAKLRIAEKI